MGADKVEKTKPQQIRDGTPSEEGGKDVAPKKESEDEGGKSKGTKPKAAALRALRGAPKPKRRLTWKTQPEGARAAEETSAKSKLAMTKKLSTWEYLPMELKMGQTSFHVKLPFGRQQEKHSPNTTLAAGQREPCYVRHLHWQAITRLATLFAFAKDPPKAKSQRSGVLDQGS